MKKLQRKKWKCRENDIEAVHNNKDYAYQRKLVALEEVKKGYFPIKRAIDLILSIVLLFLTLPIMVIFAIAIVIDSPGNPIYSQVRVGKMGKLKYTNYVRCVKTQRKTVRNGLIKMMIV